jgi:oligopeptidase A
MLSPLLQTFELPPFSAIRAADIEPAIRQLIDENRAQLQALLDAAATVQTPPTWNSLVVPLEEMQHRLARTWSPVGHLNGVLNSEELRQAYNACLPLLTAWNTELAQNERLYKAYETILEQEGAQLSAAQRKLLQNALRDYKLAGVALPPEQKQRFKAVVEKLAQVQSKFDENVLDATNAWSHLVTDRSELGGLPESILERARAAAQAAGQEGWLFALDAPNYQAVLTHADNQALRRRFYEAWSTRASDQGPNAGQWDNTALMGEILALRHELANLVQLPSFAEFSLATKMAGSVSEVREFLEELARRSRPVAQRELVELRQFAGREPDSSAAGGEPETDVAGRELNSWDVGYYSEKLKQQRLRISEEELRPYFPLPRVLEGLFTLASQLYGIRIAARTGVDLYHADVRFFDILEKDPLGAERHRGSFYIDLYARSKKRGGAWMDECVGRKHLASGDSLPVAYLVCNFMPPVGNRPALLTHSDVVTLFHEFGHGLHHMLTRVDFPSVAGINGVAWDAVELPSQFMENFAWRPEVLPWISSHVDTGEALPAGLLGQLLASRTFNAGMQTARQLEFALLDWRIHSEYGPAVAADPASFIAQILAEVRREVAVVQAPAFNRFPNSFQHIFSGGYAAGYYSYKWAEVLAADAFSAFEDAGIFDTAVAQRFLHAVLEIGGSRDPMENFIEFRGRKPRIEPLLKQLGLAA